MTLRAGQAWPSAFRRLAGASSCSGGLEDAAQRKSPGPLMVVLGPSPTCRPHRGFSPTPLPVLCGRSGAGPLAGGPRCDRVTLSWLSMGSPRPVLEHLAPAGVAHSGPWRRAHEWGRIWGQDFRLLHRGPERGVGVQQWVGEERAPLSARGGLSLRQQVALCPRSGSHRAGAAGRWQPSGLPWPPSRLQTRCAC